MKFIIEFHLIILNYIVQLNHWYMISSACNFISEILGRWNNSALMRFKVFDKFHWIASPQSILWNSTSCWNCGVGSNHASSFQLGTFHNDRSKTNMNMVINYTRSDAARMLNVNVISDVDRQWEGLFRCPVNWLYHSIVTNLGVYSNSD